MKHTVSEDVASSGLAIRHSKSDAFLRANNEIYERLMEKCESPGCRNHPETALRAVERTAWFAETFHPGRFADGALENYAFEIGARMNDEGAALHKARCCYKLKNSRRRVLHVALNVCVGGHGALMFHWMQNDASSSHSLVLINQPFQVPKKWSEVVLRSGGDLEILPPALDLVRKAYLLRDYARRSADLVVIHVIGPDAVPTVAFATDACPPVAIADHCDHCFWLGSSVADVLINLREVGARLTAERRFVSCGPVLPIPLADASKDFSRTYARESLGIPKEQVVLLSVGRGVKYRPFGEYDFASTIGRILEQHSSAHMYVVGETAAGIAPYLRHPLHSRLHFVGSLEDPTAYRAAADVYIESFPYGSQTALLEAALAGLPVIPAYAPLCQLLVANDDAIEDVLPTPESEQEHIERAVCLIKDSEQRMTYGTTLRERLLETHVGQAWLHRLHAVYEKTDDLTHRPERVPVAKCMMTEVDRGLSVWHAAVDGRSCSARAPTGAPEEVFRHSGFAAKQAGDYVTARNCAVRAVTVDPWQWESWRLVVITFLGKAGGIMRHRLFHAFGWFALCRKSMHNWNTRRTPTSGTK